MKPLFFSLTMAMATVLSAQCPTLLWSDEFDGTSLNTDDWNYQVGDGCDIGICDWGNNEQQWYQQNNVSVADGVLKIVARQESAGGKAYTSGRINTKNKQDLKYGYLETRMKIPPGGGLWPAFWMLSTDEVFGGWPTSGEIDIMEWTGNEPERLFGTIHFGQASPNNQSSGETLDLDDASWSDEYHIYAVLWEPNRIRWYVDGYLYSSKSTGSVNGEIWPFNEDFHFLFNMAVGGIFGGAIEPGIFPATMEVDYVRVYDLGPPTINGMTSVDEGATERYSVSNLPDEATVVWTAPEGSEIDSSPDLQGRADVTFGGVSGQVIATVTTNCGTYILKVPVAVIPGIRYDFSFENFDDEAQAIYEFSNGALTEVANPTPNSVNGSALVATYTRDAGSQFDVIVYGVTTIENGDDYVAGERGFSIDVNTMAPIGTEVLLQLETNTASGDNYPTGRHSRFLALTTTQGAWHRLTFTLLDEPDGGANPAGIQKMVVLFEANSNSGNTYLYDNLDSYSDMPTSVLNPRQLDFPLSLRPNPASSEVQLAFTLSRAEAFDLQLFDVAGREVVRQENVAGFVGEQTLRLSLEGLSRGVYFVRMAFAGGVRTVRLIKE
jgi:beta-glucanase (GH16 family)